MNEHNRFLPIGTICTIKSSNKKIMITGFFSIEYSGNVKMFDYSGCDYPEGLLLSNKTCSFNHNDIAKIEYLGYQSVEHQKFNDLLNRQNTIENKDEYVTSPVLTNIQYDDNGVVVFENISSRNSVENSVIPPVLNEVSKSTQVIDNPFAPTYQANIQEQESSLKNDSNSWPIFKSITYDENGIIISAEENRREEMA